MDNDVWWAGCTPVPDVERSIQDKRWEGYVFSDGMRVDCVPLDYAELEEVYSQGNVQVRYAYVEEGKILRRVRSYEADLLRELAFSEAVKHGVLVFITSNT